MPEPDYLIRQNDKDLVIRTILEDANGTPVNLSGATVRFHMSNIDGTATGSIATAAVNENATSTGQVAYTLTAANTTTPGLYLAEFQVTFSSTAIQTYPNNRFILVRVTPQVA